MVELSMAMKEMLRKVQDGNPSYFGGGAYQISNTNRTADALESRGLIERAADQSRARQTLCRAWVLTEAGRKALA